MIVAVSDLDRTLVYSTSALELVGPDETSPRLLCVETYEHRPLSFMTETAATGYAALAARGAVVPATTRTVAQMRRVRLPGPRPRFAICANGGRLLVDGEEDAGFSRDVERQLASGGAPHAVFGAVLTDAAGRSGGGVLRLHDAVGLFWYAIVDRSVLADGWLAALVGRAAAAGWAVSVQGRKLYCVPAALTKSAAAQHVAERIGASRWVAAGDSLLDADLLAAAAVGVMPVSGELAASGWTAPGVRTTRARGVLAGEEVVDWLAAELAS